MATVDGAGRSGDDKGAVGVAVDEPGNGGAGFFTERVGAEPGRCIQLGRVRYALLKHGIRFICAADERGVIRRDGHGERVLGLLHGVRDVNARKMALQVGKRPDAVLELVDPGRISIDGCGIFCWGVRFYWLVHFGPVGVLGKRKRDRITYLG